MAWGKDLLLPGYFSDLRRAMAAKLSRSLVACRFGAVGPVALCFRRRTAYLAQNEIKDIAAGNNAHEFLFPHHGQ
jgi:hypothetical protein